MSRKSLIWRLFPSYLLVIAISLIAAILFVSGAMRDFYVDQTFSDLHARAVLFRRQTEELIHENRLDEIDKLCKQLGPESGTRITVISPD